MKPLTPIAVAAHGDAARRLAQRLLRYDDEALAQLNGVGGSDVLVVGPDIALPWGDGVIYLGHDPAAPHLLLPTMLAPSVPLPLLERALRQQSPDLASPLAVIPATQQLLSLAAARPIARETLLRWLEGNT